MLGRVALWQAPAAATQYESNLSGSLRLSIVCKYAYGSVPQPRDLVIR